ncbi:MAG TPA: hypothetical protein VMW41_06575 [Candidatus Bathyarchaeia archaeon]|nr:hypothetical protein [Candidatus Bathyarchaeia archaeon]
MAYKICISGAAAGPSVKTGAPLAAKIGEEIAKRGHILVTGATVGVSFEAAKAAKKTGGVVVGFSPASSEEEHVGKFQLPESKYFDYVVYTKSGYTGRNLLMVRSCDATIIIAGRVGTLNEFTCAFEENEIVGVLEGSGGIADEIRKIIKIAGKGKRKTFFERDPVIMVDEIFRRIKSEKKEKKKFHLEYR